MKILLTSFAFISTVFFGCSLAKPEGAITLMDSYWKLYERKQYDSLRTFYIPKGDNPQERLSGMLNELKNVDNRFGKVIEVRLTKSTSENSFEDGKSVRLEYEVIYENAIIPHSFYFKEEKGIYKILEHSFES